MNRSVLLSSWLVLAGAVLPVQAGLEFEKTTVKVDVRPQDDEAKVDFKFKVTGDKTITLKDLEMTCGCLNGTFDQTVYKPGESGQVHVTMRVGSFEGEVNKAVYVLSDDAKNPRIELYCVVNVPQIYEFDSRVSTWEVGEAVSTKKVKMKVVAKEPIKVLKVTSSRENLSVSFKEITPGREYEVSLTPKSTEKPELGMVSIETDCAIEKFSHRQIFFNIQKKRVTSAANEVK